MTQDVDSFFSDLTSFRASLRKEVQEIKIPELKKSVWVMRETTGERISWGEKDGVEENDYFTTQIWRLMYRLKDSSGNDLFKSQEDKDAAFLQFQTLPSNIVDRIAGEITKYDLKHMTEDFEKKSQTSEEEALQESA